MVKDLITDEEWEMAEGPASVPPKPEKKQDGRMGFKDYVIVALIALLAVMGINRYIDARGANGNNAAGSYGINTANSADSGGGCCGGSGGAAAAGTDLAQLGLAYYTDQYGDTGAEAQLQNLGCHQEVHIYQDGQLVAKIGYQGGQFYEIGL